MIIILILLGSAGGRLKTGEKGRIGGLEAVGRKRV
jgi:hypothetical protein